MPVRLLEREPLLERLVAAHAAGGRLVLLGVDAGAGKTTLVRRSVLRKLGVRTRGEAAAAALQLGMLAATVSRDASR